MSKHVDITLPNNVLPEQTETEKKTEMQKEKENRRDLLYNVLSPEISTGQARQPAPAAEGEMVLVPSEEYFDAACKEFTDILRGRHGRERSRVDWDPTAGELRKLFYGGNPDHKLWLCRQAMNLMGGRLDYPRLVLRALGLMLEASKVQRIQNPFGWVWSCLHGFPDGRLPWVHVMTAREEAERIRSPRPPP